VGLCNLAKDREAARQGHTVRSRQAKAERAKRINAASELQALISAASLFDASTVEKAGEPKT